MKNNACDQEDYLNEALKPLVLALLLAGALAVSLLFPGTLEELISKLSSLPLI